MTTKTPARPAAAPHKADAKKPAATTAAKPVMAKKPAIKASAPDTAKKAPAKKATARTKAATPKKPATAKKAPTVKATTKKTARPAASKSRTSARKPVARKKTSRAPKPKGLEASYSGEIFRSRLEARWAILLDLLEINWDYEPSHYQVGPQLWYLPDFYLPDIQLWLEVKGPVFMDAQSNAKCLASVAGPMPLPLREAPYTAAPRLLIGGPLHARTNTRPVHTLVTKASTGKAALSYAQFGRGGPMHVSEPWDVAPADGIAKARRPLPNRVTAMVDPPSLTGAGDSEVLAAYKIAAGMTFDETTKGISTTDRQVLHRLSRRRAGRPLGPFPSR